jgi:hypothetical protein
VRHDWRPTRLRFGEVIWLGRHARLDVSVGAERPWVAKFLEAKVPPKRKRKEPFPRDQRELCLAAAWRLIDDGQSVLIYCPERRSVDPFAEAIADLHDRGLLHSVLQGDLEQLSTALSIGHEWLGADHPILKSLKLGVAIHHGALPTPFRKEIERLLRDGVLRLTVSSPTLAQGLNLSATCILFHGVVRNREPIEASEFKNIIGRAGRAYVDVEGLVLCPMFDRIDSRRRAWRQLTAHIAGQEMESGLLRLVITLMQRMIKKLGKLTFDQLADYVLNNAAAWDFSRLAGESDEQASQEQRRWQQHVASLDTAILSLLGDQEISDADIETKLDEILTSSLWDRRIRRRSEDSQRAIKSGLVGRARFIWGRSNPSQRRGYFLAGIGFDTGRRLDAIAAQANQLLVVANGAVLAGDAELAVEAITGLAERIFVIQPFIPDPFPANWREVLKVWLLGQPIAEAGAGHDTEILQFIEGGLIYRLPWGMEALRVRALANLDPFDDSSTLDEFELRSAVPAVETGTLNRSAALLMHAGFAARLAAIKAVREGRGQFQNARELADWLKSDHVDQLTRAGNWPIAETAEMWHSFRASYTPSSNRVWKKTSVTVSAAWNDGVSFRPGSPLRLADDARGLRTNVLSPDFELVGALRRRLNPQRCGSTIATVGQGRGEVELTYLGPDELFAA